MQNEDSLRFVNKWAMNTCLLHSVYRSIQVSELECPPKLPQCRNFRLFSLLALGLGTNDGCFSSGRTSLSVLVIPQGCVCVCVRERKRVTVLV